WDIGAHTRCAHGPEPHASPLLLDTLLAAYGRVISVETLFCTFELLKIERHRDAGLDFAFPDRWFEQCLDFALQVTLLGPLVGELGLGLCEGVHALVLAQNLACIVHNDHVLRI